MSEEVRITGLDAATTMAEGDLFVGVDVSDNTGADDGTEKKYTAKQVAEASKDSTITLTNKTISVDSNTISGISASSFVLSNASGNLDGTVAQKVIPAGAVVGTTDTQTLTNKTLTSPTITTPTITTPTITGWDGWQPANETWTYASASTFTVTGDQTSKYTVGTKLKWTQTTVRYGEVTAVAYANPNTTVTIAVNTDYTIADSAISANFYSYANNPVGYPSGLSRSPVSKCILTRTTNQSIPNATRTPIEFTSELYDPTGLHDNSTNNSRITIKESGIYQIFAQANLDDSGTETIRLAVILLNGVDTPGPSTRAGVDGGGRWGLAINWAMSLSAGDYLELAILQNSGGALSCTLAMLGITKI